MADVEQIITEPSDAEKRIKQLSDKVKDEASAKEAANAAKEAAEARAAESERKAQFAESFSDVVANNPAAKDHKEDIRAKVMSGYTVQDATYAVLGAAGKFNQPKIDSPAGGSATITPSQGEKKIADMSQDERRAKLAEELIVT